MSLIILFIVKSYPQLLFTPVEQRLDLDDSIWNGFTSNQPWNLDFKEESSLKIYRVDRLIKFETVTTSSSVESNSVHVSDYTFHVITFHWIIFDRRDTF